MFKRRRDRIAERARCSSWVVGARKAKAASIGGLFHTKPAMTPIGTTFRTRRHYRRASAIGEKRKCLEHPQTDVNDPLRSFACKSLVVRIGQRRWTSTQPRAFRPALRKPLTSDLRAETTVLSCGDTLSNAAGAQETAFSDARFASAVRPSISGEHERQLRVCAFRGTFWVAPSS